jgi:hypothetical protein
MRFWASASARSFPMKLATQFVMRMNATSFRPYEKARGGNPGFEKR